MTHHREEYLAAGMDAVSPKPIELTALLETMERVLSAAEEDQSVCSTRVTSGT